MMLEKYLNHYFHFTTFRPGQKEVVTSILEGCHTMAMLPTGTGKSLCYQLAGYMMDGHVLIVSPLLSLMQDQVEQMKMNGEKSVVAINSFLVGKERNRVLNNLSSYKFIFISPEALVNDRMIGILRSLSISLFVIDEAHCISQWGYDFRPDYLKLGDIRRKLGQPLTLALTATATKQVIQDIIHSLQLDECKRILFSVDRPNIALAVKKIDNYQEKWTALYHYISKFTGPGIVYFSSKKVAEQAADYLKKKGISRVMAYHGGMDQESRVLIQQQFLNDQLDIICATSAFGMGINKENIRFVIHFHMSQQMESYLQEIGRGGRDGKPSIALLLYSLGDEQIAYQLAEAEIPSTAQLDWLASVLEKEKKESFQQPELQDELKQRGGFTDIQWRILSDFLLQQNAEKNGIRSEIDEFKKILENRRLLKSRKIASMTSWSVSESCRRDQILYYFQEDNKMSKPEQCCDICGFDVSSFDQSTVQENVHVEFSWKQRLADILLK
ncbi:ATP-dependent DNA helicase RecQ [Bacillus sp. V3B]|uniref:RecQ family ATP-dependent DNA helicase n=1 Tax=Bacillus sp. V3B TaxID=2804915 RepID=UPI0021089FE2|nr:RecQ family ATP-dependent DNA helicase [Bacillus sp. V3B]MCQ6273843.1 ATP-dependent DNA helicase RecQ [Bacillus sp. V3B]